MEDFLTIHSEAVIAALFGGAVVFCLEKWLEAWTSAARLEGVRLAIRAEIEVCGGRAQTFVEGKVPAPLYRLPSRCFADNFSALVQSGTLDRDGTHDLIVFYAEVETLNRGLDDAAVVFGPNNAAGSQTKEDVNSRNVLKATRLIAPSGVLYWRAFEAVS